MDPLAPTLSETFQEALALAKPRCNLCARLCDAPRGETQEDGSGGAWCRAPHQPAIASEMVHVGEEAELVPSHAIFFAGCLAKCSFCQAWRFSQDAKAGVHVPSSELAALIDRRREEGARNVNFVGGDATLYIPYVIETLAQLKKPQTVVWNTAMYHGPKTAKVLEGFVDVYLGDWKFGNDACALKIGGFTNYIQTLTVAFELAAKSTAGLYVRHLVMPGHVECCTKPSLEAVAQVAPRAKLSLMTHYVPSFKAAGELGRVATPNEVANAETLATVSGLSRVL